MKIKLQISLAAPTFAYKAGDIIEIEDAEAVRWLNAGFAVAVRDEPLVETAMLKTKKPPRSK